MSDYKITVLVPHSVNISASHLHEAGNRAREFVKKLAQKNPGTILKEVERRGS